VDTAYDRGTADTLKLLGLEKVAYLGRVGTKLWRAQRWLHKKAPTWKGVREEMFGQPTRLVKEIARGKALSKGSVIRESFNTPTALTKMMFYGFPAVESAGIALDDEGNKATRIGGALGGGLLGLGAYKPLGLVGSMAMDPIGRSIGSAVGQTVGHLGNKVMGKPAQPNRPAGTPVQPNRPVGNLPQHNNALGR